MAVPTSDQYMTTHDLSENSSAPETAGSYYIETHGCQMNDYDSARIGDLLQSCNMKPTLNAEHADLLLINTCSIRDKAQQKLFHRLGRWRALKRRQPSTLIAVGGCVASQEGQGISDRVPEVDIIFGPQTLHRLPDMVRRARLGSDPRQTIVDVSFPLMEKFDTLPPPGIRGPVASVSVMEGCSRYCSFCVVPYTRGREVSRDAADILSEVITLAEGGVREITLLGQNVNAYCGRDHRGRLIDLADLIREIVTIEGIGRIRFTTSHPAAFSDNLAEVFGEVEQLAGHLHLPVQSGSDRVLAAMKRGYTVLEFKDRLRTVRRFRPSISISSDFIVGFPGETERDFEKTLSLMEEVRFDTSFSFIYSPRPGTPAAALTDELPPEVKKSRLQRLQALNNRHAADIAQSMIGSCQQILITGPSRRSADQMQGRTENNRVVNIPRSGGSIPVGQFLTVWIDEARPHSLLGRVAAAGDLGQHGTCFTASAAD